jgi:HSP20 family molecular chaperone IbpA
MIERYTESPEIMTWVDSEQSALIVQFTLVDTAKENITLMMDENGCYLSASADDVQYIATVSFLRAVKPADTKATYQDSYLTVSAPLKDPLDSYLKVAIE